MLADSTTTIAELKSRVLILPGAAIGAVPRPKESQHGRWRRRAAELMGTLPLATPEQSAWWRRNRVKRAKIAEELADVVIYALEFANTTGLDLLRRHRGEDAGQREKISGREGPRPSG